MLAADIAADNGVIHVLNRVILMGGDGPVPGDVTKGWYSQPVTGL